MTLASLPMYAAPRAATAAFWSAIRDRLVARDVPAPDTLSEPDDLLAHWRSPDLLFSQTCGLPFSTELTGEVTLLAVPHYDAPGCEGPSYRSLIVARAGDAARTPGGLVGRRAAVNSVGSHSGFSQLVTTLAPFARGGQVLGEIVLSGSHHGSLSLVREDAADVAAIDCVTWAMLELYDDPHATAGLKIVGRSPPTLGLPFIASRRLPPFVLDAVREALVDVIRDPALEVVRRSLLLDGVSFPEAGAYCGHAETAHRSLNLTAEDAGEASAAPVKDALPSSA